MRPIVWISVFDFDFDVDVDVDVFFKSFGEWGKIKLRC